MHSPILPFAEAPLSWTGRRLSVPCAELRALLPQPFYDMVDGMRMDLIKARYETWDELYEYCYRVAGTVRPPQTARCHAACTMRRRPLSSGALTP